MKMIMEESIQKKNRKKRVLVFPCGSEIGLEINRSLRGSTHFEMIGASSIADHGKYVYANYIEGIPFVDSPLFIPSIKKICQEQCIDFIFPAHDSVVLKLAQYQKELPATVITSRLSTCQIARSKRKTYEKLRDIVPCPQVYRANNDSSISFPVFVKPDRGQGSKGAYRVDSWEDLKYALNKNKEIIITEFLPGEEYTVDCFTNSQGKLLFVGARKRLRINNGISVRTCPVKDIQLEKMAHKINCALPFNGMWFFQTKKDAFGKHILLELAPRIAGTMGMYRGLGVNFAQLALFNAMGNTVQIQCGGFDIEMDRALSSSYKTNLQYSSVYIDLDDTIIINQKVNSQAMQFLYQAFNEGKELFLITKHRCEIRETFQQYALPERLFKQIIHLQLHEEKSSYVTEKSAIFIDDSYSERMKVFNKCKIPVFGIESLDVLINVKN